MKVLVTGGAGFLGHYVVRRFLELGYDVVVFDQFNSETTQSTEKHDNLLNLKYLGNLKIYQGDILEEDLLPILQQEKINHCVHAASLVDDRRSVKYPDEYIRVNILGTQRIMAAFGEAKVKQVVLISTRSVYGQTNNPLNLMSEDSPKFPINPYGASKLGAELFAHVYHHLYGINVNIIRISAIYGHRGRPDMIPRQLIEKIHNQIPIPKFGLGTATRDWLYVEDAVDAIVLAIQKPLGYEVFNVGTTVATSLNEIIGIAEKVIVKQAIIQNLPVPPGDAGFVGIIDINKARTILGWTPKTSLEEGIKESYKQYLESLETAVR